MAANRAPARRPAVIAAGQGTVAPTDLASTSPQGAGAEPQEFDHDTAVRDQRQRTLDLVKQEQERIAQEVADAAAANEAQGIAEGEVSPADTRFVHSQLYDSPPIPMGQPDVDPEPHTTYAKAPARLPAGVQKPSRPAIPGFVRDLNGDLWPYEQLMGLEITAGSPLAGNESHHLVAQTTQGQKILAVATNAHDEVEDYRDEIAASLRGSAADEE